MGKSQIIQKGHKNSIVRVNFPFLAIALQLSNKKYYGSVNIIAPISLIDEKQKRVIALSISGWEEKIL